MASSFIGEDKLCQVMNNHILLETILSNLGARDLLLNRLICRQWMEMIDNIIKKRSSVETFLLVNFTGKIWRDHIAKESHGLTATSLTVKQKVLIDLIGKGQSILKCKSDAMMLQSMKNYFHDQLKSFPDVALLFSSSNSIFRKMTEKLNTTLLPPICQKVYIVSSPGIIGTPSLSSSSSSSSSLLPKPIEIEKHYYHVDGLASSFLNTSWSDFIVTLTNWTECESPEPNLSEENYPLRCLLVFSTVFDDNERFNHFRSQIKKPIALGGAIVDKIILDNKPCELLTIAFSGKNISSASLILETRTEKESMDQLVKFKNKLSFNADETGPNVKTLGYIFICAGRGTQFYDKSNVESDLLRKVFPNVVFSGVFGGGEYGADFDGKSGNPDDDPVKSFEPVCKYLSYTTVIVLVHFNKE